MSNPKEVFVEEAQELLTSMEEALLKLEDSPNDVDIINDLFRSVHNIKGSSGVFSFDDLVSFTHLVETVLDGARSDPEIINEEFIVVMLACKDHIDELVSIAINDGALSGQLASKQQELSDSLKRYIDGYYLEEQVSTADDEPDEVLEEIEAEPASQVSSDYWHISVRFEREIFKHGMDPLSILRYLQKLGSIVQLTTVHKDFPSFEEYDPELCYLGFEIDFASTAYKKKIESAFEFVKDMCLIHILPPRASVDHYADMIRELPEDNRNIGDILVASGTLTQAELDYALKLQSSKGNGKGRGKTKPLGEILVENMAVHREIIETALEKQSKDREKLAAKKRALRVDADKLDKLINLVGELVIAGATTNLLVHRVGDEQLSESMSGISRLVEDIRDQALNLRMVQIGETFSRFKRVVRDVSRDLNKDIRLVISGADTELDKTVVENLADPLMHLIRNAMDHGIESAQERIDKGKPAEGHVYLNAYHDSGNIVVEVADDGRGYSKERILKKARENGIIGENQEISEQELHRLVLEAGFSTADHVTNLSGRGVGMDVVKKNIDNLRGTLDIESSEGAGTKVSLRVPLTLAIIDGFLVNVGQSSYVVPLDLVNECIELDGETECDEGLHGYISLRGEVLPFLRLKNFYKEAGEDVQRESIVVVRHGENKIGFVVDELVGEFQTVIKPMGSIFQNLRGVSGATILGTGEVAVILDVPRLIDYAATLANHYKSRNDGKDSSILH